MTTGQRAVVKESAMDQGMLDFTVSSAQAAIFTGNSDEVFLNEASDLSGRRPLICSEQV
jgi:hypothetical protein